MSQENDDDDERKDSLNALFLCLSNIRMCDEKAFMVVKMSGQNSHSFQIIFENNMYSVHHTTYFHIFDKTPEGQKECNECGDICNGPCMTFQCTLETLTKMHEYIASQPGQVIKIFWNLNDNRYPLMRSTLK